MSAPRYEVGDLVELVWWSKESPPPNVAIQFAPDFTGGTTAERREQLARAVREGASKAAPAIAAEPPRVPSASEALYGFAGWLTSRRVPVIMGGAHDAGVVAGLVEAFCRANGLEEPRDGWTAALRHPTETAEPAEAGPSAVAAAPAARPHLTVACQSQYDPDE